MAKRSRCVACITMLGVSVWAAASCSSADREYDPGGTGGGASNPSGSGGQGASGQGGQGGESTSTGTSGGGGGAPCGNEADACGPSCIDCTQPNATAICDGTECANICVGETFPAATCPGPGNGKPACGSWDFESQSTEGWELYDETLYTASGGPIEVSSDRAILNTQSLAVPIETTGGYGAVAVRVRFCDGGQAVNLDGKTIRARVHTEPGVAVACYPDGGSEGFIELFNGSTKLIAGADFTIPCSGPSWYSFQLPVSYTAVTELGFVFRVFSNWTGTFYLDDVRIE
jgi:hypothetical protein